MSNAATLSAPTPTAQRALRTTVPPGIAQVLYVLEFLISYACHMGGLAEECAMRGDLRPVTKSFGKAIGIEALIIRICRGLRRALAMREMLQQRAAEGIDIEPVKRRQPSGSGGGGSKDDGEDEDKQPKVERLPSAAEIAAELEHRPLGAIVADICHDIGITPSDLTDEQWDALQWVLHEYGGSTMKLWSAIKNRIVTGFEVIATDPEHAEMPLLPMVPWTRMAKPGAAEVRRTGPPWV